MPLQVEIMPRPDATPDQLKHLASALREWFAAYLKDAATIDPDVDGWIDEAALDDLRAGELPQPTVLRLLKDQPGIRIQDMRDAIESARAMFPLARRTIPSPNARCVALGFSLIGTPQQRDHMLGSLRRDVPVEYLAQIAVNGSPVADDPG
jgi:hypothetical protein